MTEREPAAIDVALCHPRLALAEDGPENWRTHAFAITPEEPDAARMFDSCVATPARYLFEMYRRIDARLPETGTSLFLFNPLLLLRSDELLLVLAVLRRIENQSERDQAICVLCDTNDTPLGYLLPRTLIDDASYLLLLSCSKASLDASALAVIYGCAARSAQVDLAVSVSLATSNGFHTASYLRPNEVCCAHARDVLTARYSSFAADDHQARLACRAALPIFAFVSHHAGDVLFATLAARSVPALFHGLVIHSDYAAICRHAGLALPTLEFTGPVAHRRGYTGDDPEHFLDVFPQLPDDRLYVYARTTRDYNYSNYHLIDHFAFMLGAPRASVAEFDGGQPATCPASIPAAVTAAGSKRILLHFDAGWPLKVYPPEWQQELVDLLLRQGHSVTVMDAKTPSRGCRSVRFESLSYFKALLAEHHLLIGMDSFPAHYASLVHETPTLCLFASTHPVHSRTQPSLRYQWLSEELGCAPCRSFQTCPRFGGTVCRNFPRPTEVCQTAEQMMAATEAKASTALPSPRLIAPSIAPRSETFKSLPSAQVPQRLRLQRPVLVSLRPERLHFVVAYRRYRTAHALRSLQTIRSLFAEYLAALRGQGLWRANSLTWGYLMRLMGRPQKPDAR